MPEDDGDPVPFGKGCDGALNPFSLFGEEKILFGAVRIIVNFVLHFTVAKLDRTIQRKGF